MFEEIQGHTKVQSIMSAALERVIRDYQGVCQPGKQVIVREF